MNEEWLSEQKDIDRGREPIRLYCDLEVAPSLSWHFGWFKTTPIKTEQDPVIISIAWQWEGEKKIYCETIQSRYLNPFKLNDKKITKKLHDLMMEADIIIGHNWDGFDHKTAQARFLYYRLEPLNETKTIDTLKIARKYFKMPRNSLDDIYRYLFGKSGKTQKKYSDLVFGCIKENNPKEWKLMELYNKRDVEITRDVYLAMRPFHKTHPNLSFYTRRPSECPKCLSNKIQSRGKQRTRIGFRKKYQCQECAGWFSGEILKDEQEKIKTYA